MSRPVFGDGSGRVSGTVRRTGSWDGSCDSVLRPGRHARYYSFTLAGSSSVTIDLASSQDPFMALRAGSGTSGTVIETDDDGGPGNNSRIARTLSAGTYTIEATTFATGRTGSFTLTLMVEGGGAGCATDLGRVSGTVRRTGSWDGSCDSTHRPGRYARYYTFVVTRAVEVSISLASATDTYLFLLAGSGTDGTVLALNDDGGDGTNSRIVRPLAAGTYTVEATTFPSGSTGSFTLRVSERRPFADDPVVAGMSIRAVHLTELRGRIDELRVGVGLPRYSWVDRTIRPGETRVRAVHWQQLRAALGEVYDADGRRRPQYTDAIRVGDAIEARHVNELRRAVEGLR